jgi:uncharacterized protein
MIAVDSNLLVFAHRGESPLHARAVDVLKGLAAAPGNWAIPMPCLHEFYATVTSTKCKPPSTLAQAWGMIDSLVGLPNARVIGESADHLVFLREITIRAKVMGGMVHDAKIAAICRAHGVDELWTCDRDYSRFPELKTHNPFEASHGRHRH